MYHAVTDVDECLRKRYPLVYRNAVTAEQLDSHIRYLKSRSDLLSVEEFIDCQSRRQFPRMGALLTFDDGLKCFGTVADPLLARHGVPAVVFLVTGLMDRESRGEVAWQWTEAVAALVYARGVAMKSAWKAARSLLPVPLPDVSTGVSDEALIRLLWQALWQTPRAARSKTLDQLVQAVGGLPDSQQFPADRRGTSVLAPLSWQDARRLLRPQLSFGSHSINHVRLSELGGAEAQWEVLGSLSRIAEELSQRPRMFAYPYGDTGADASLDNGLKRAGVLASFSAQYGFIRGAARHDVMPRVGVPGDCSTPRLAYYLSGLRGIHEQRTGRRVTGRPW